MSPEQLTPNPTLSVEDWEFVRNIFPQVFESAEEGLAYWKTEDHVNALFQHDHALEDELLTFSVIYSVSRETEMLTIYQLEPSTESIKVFHGVPLGPVEPDKFIEDIKFQSEGFALPNRLDVDSLSKLIQHVRDEVELFENVNWTV